MNELIERLAREAGLIQGILVKSPSRDDLEIFAKAVARECVKACRQSGDNPYAIAEKFGLQKVVTESKASTNR